MGGPHAYHFVLFAYRNNEKLVRNALLTWDAIEYIAPFDGYRTHYEDKEVQEAMDLISRPRVVTGDEQREVHELVVDLLAQDVPETFKYALTAYDGRYEIWPQKIAPETWHYLSERGFTTGPLDDHDYPMSQAADCRSWPSSRKSWPARQGLG